MVWPFTRRKVEVRQTAPYTDAIVEAIAAAASGKVIASADATAALESASGLLGRVMASTRVEGPAMAQNALSADFFAAGGPGIAEARRSSFPDRRHAGRPQVDGFGQLGLRGRC